MVVGGCAACREARTHDPVILAEALVLAQEGVAGAVNPADLASRRLDALRRLGREVLGGAELALDRDSSPARRSLGEYSLRSGLALLGDTVVGPVLDALRDHLPSASTHDPTSIGLPGGCCSSSWPKPWTAAGMWPPSAR